jgi:hypothetical protein
MLEVATMGRNKQFERDDVTEKAPSLWAKGLCRYFVKGFRRGNWGMDNMQTATTVAKGT